MSERMLSAIQTVEKGGRPVFPLMPFSAFLSTWHYSEKPWKRKKQKH